MCFFDIVFTTLICNKVFQSNWNVDVKVAIEKRVIGNRNISSFGNRNECFKCQSSSSGRCWEIFPHTSTDNRRADSMIKNYNYHVWLHADAHLHRFICDSRRLRQCWITFFQGEMRYHISKKVVNEHKRTVTMPFNLWPPPDLISFFLRQSEHLWQF